MISEKGIELLKITEERIIKEINDKFMAELHIDGRLYDNEPKCSIWTETVDDEILLHIRSYITSIINEIILDNINNI